MLAFQAVLTSLTEQVLQILPSYSIGELEITINMNAHNDIINERDRM
jgi:hypothetical protein